MSCWKLRLGPEGRQAASQSRRPSFPQGNVLLVSAALQSRFGSDLRAGASGNTGERLRLTAPRPELHLSWESLYYSPRAVNHSVEDTRQFHQAPLKAGGSETNQESCSRHSQKSPAQKRI